MAPARLRRVPSPPPVRFAACETTAGAVDAILISSATAEGSRMQMIAALTRPKPVLAGVLAMSLALTGCATQNQGASGGSAVDRANANFGATVATGALA